MERTWRKECQQIRRNRSLVQHDLFGCHYLLSKSNTDGPHKKKYSVIRTIPRVLHQVNPILPKMKSFITSLLLTLLVASCSAFQSAQTPRLTTSLGLFGGKKPPAKNDNAWLEGRGKRITIRDDEDAAMWIDEPKKKDAGKKGTKKDEKPKKKGWFS